MLSHDIKANSHPAQKMTTRRQPKTRIAEWDLPSSDADRFPAGRYTEILTISGGQPPWANLVSHGPVIRLDSKGNQIPWEPKRVIWNLTALGLFIRKYVRLGKTVGVCEVVKEHPSHIAGTLVPKKIFLDFRSLCDQYKPLLDLVQRADGMRIQYDIPGQINAVPVARKLLHSLASALAGHHSKGIGAPKGSRSLSADEQKLAETIRKRRKGTEKGSIRMIASKISETRGYSLKKEGRKAPAIERTLKRHFRSKKV